MRIRVPMLVAMSFALVLVNGHAGHAQLSRTQVVAVRGCQDALDREGRTLIRETEEAVEACGLVKLNAVLRLENGVTTPAMFTTEDNRATLTCNRDLASLVAQVTRSIDAMFRACGPVEALVLAPGTPPAGDPLGLVAAHGFSTIAQVVSAVCEESLIQGLALANDKGPRATDLTGDPNIVFPPIDPRCL